LRSRHIISIGNFPVDATVADFNGDGHSDIAAYVLGKVTLLPGNGNGTFSSPTVVASIPRQTANGDSIVAVDLDDNGAVDLVVADTSQNPTSTSIHAIVNLRLPPVDHGLRLSTSHGGNTGPVTLTVFGTEIPEGSAAKLDCPNQPDIVGANVVVSPDGFKLIATFNLVGALPGQCTVTVVKPDGTSKSAVKVFTIELGGKAETWIDIIGFDSIRPGRPQKYYLPYGNRGNVDAQEVAACIQVSAGLELRVLSPATVVETVHDALNGNTYAVFTLSNVAAQESAVLTIELYLSPSAPGREFVLNAWLGSPNLP
jgi:hypothetical protein